jgi:hypothetical protein
MGFVCYFVCYLLNKLVQNYTKYFRVRLVRSLYDYANIRGQVDSNCHARQGSTVDELIEAVCALLHVVCKRLSFILTRIRQCKLNLRAKHDKKQWIRKSRLLEIEA